MRYQSDIVATADKKVIVSEAGYHEQTYSYWVPTGAQDNKRKDPRWYPIPRRNSNGGALGSCTDLATPTVFLVGQPSCN